MLRQHSLRFHHRRFAEEMSAFVKNVLQPVTPMRRAA
jgi:hypothetical protein